MAAGTRDDDAGVDLERRRISVAAALTLLGGATITLGGCGGGGGTSSPSAPSAPPPTTTPPAAACPPGGACGQVGGDPSHRAEITAAQLGAEASLTLDIQGMAAHSHMVSLSAAEVVMIRERRRVEKTSSAEVGHNHQVWFN